MIADIAAGIPAYPSNHAAQFLHSLDARIAAEAQRLAHEDFALRHLLELIDAQHPRPVAGMAAAAFSAAATAPGAGHLDGCAVAWVAPCTDTIGVAS